MYQHSPSDTRSESARQSLRLYRHRHRGAETWDLYQVAVSALRKEEGPLRYRGSNRSGPEPDPLTRALRALSDPRLPSPDPCFCTELQSPTLGPRYLLPEVSLSPCFFRFSPLSQHPTLALRLPPLTSQPHWLFSAALALLLDLDTFCS